MRKGLLVLFFFVQWVMGYALSQLTNLPTLYLTTEGGTPVTSKDVYVSGTLSIVGSDLTQNLDSVGMQIRGRGNSTWELAKKPYRIKLHSKRQLLGMQAKAKDWVLLANHADKTLMRNAIAFEVGRFIGMNFTPSVRFVDVVLNGKYLGNYQLTDQVEVGEDRVDIEKQDPLATEEPAIRGGYLMEIDGFAWRESLWFETDRGLSVSIKYPDDTDINAQQLTYIKDFTNQFEATLFASEYIQPTTGYRSNIDSASLVNWYIACELTGNPDSFWSTYIYT